MKRFFCIFICISICTIIMSSCTKKSDKNNSDNNDNLLASTLYSEDESQVEANQYVKPANTSVITIPAEDSDDWALFLVNNYFSLPSSYNPKTVSIDGEKKFHIKAADDFKAMLKAADEAGEKLYVVSAYRTIDYQRNLFENNVKKLEGQGMTEKEARVETARNIAKPGMSEHNTGLATDLVSASWYTKHDDLTEDFENTSEFKWLDENAYKYGFILRYPKGKEEITEITYEPWHYRYVGIENAQNIKESGLTLEEYIWKNNK